MNTNRKIYFLLFFNIAAFFCAFYFYALPKIKIFFIENASLWQGSPAADLALKSLDRHYLALSAGMAFLAAALLGLSVYITGLILKPVNNFTDSVSKLFPRAGKDSLEEVTAGIETAFRNAVVIDSVPIGIMVVDSNGFIRMFNREAGEITETDPSLAIGGPLMRLFPNNYYNYTMEVIKTGREYLGLRNIIKVGGFFREVLFSISPLRSGDSVTGAVAVFQDVTPQRRMIEVRAAYTLARDLSTQKDLDGTVRIIANSAAEMVDIDFSAVFLADQDGRLIIRSAFGIPAEAVEKYNSSPLYIGGPEISNLYLNRVPLLHGDVRNKPNLEPLLVVTGINSFYSFPVLYDEHLIGLLNLYSREKNKLSKDMIYLIRSLSGHLNTAITNFYELQKMRTLASVDGLTGLFNKKYLLDTLGVQLLNASTSGSPLSLAMIDIDHFKRINDTFGHQAGDQILKDIAGLLSSSVRESDCVCRYGGEEFSVIMPGTPRDRALEVLERIRSGVESMVFCNPENEPLKISVSGGVASFPDDALKADDLILLSDTALYTAKRTGRNRVLGYSPDQKLARR